VIVLGLTGSIGMGKSTAAAVLRSLGLPLFDADRAVHRLLEPNGLAVEPVAAAFPGVAAGSGGIDRRLLGRRVFGDPAALAQLEAILHPMVEQAEGRFLGWAQGRRAPIAVLDIPLLFETGGDRRCDYVIVVSAPALVQRQRVLRRPGMSRERFAAILRQQMPDSEKQRRADFSVPTGLNRNLSLRRLRAIVRLLRAAPPGRRAGRRRTSYLEKRRRRCVKSS
jgi:dephospho-CoA kinase